MIKSLFKPLFFSKRFFWTFAVIIALFVLSYNLRFLFLLNKLIVFLFLAAVLADYLLLFTKRSGILARRILPERFSNGDQNPVHIIVENKYPFKVAVSIIDELPAQFQDRHFLLAATLAPAQQVDLHYSLRPLERGEFIFNDLNVFITSPLGFVRRRFKIPAQQAVKVYPSYFALRQYDLLAYSNNLAEAGNRKIRKIGQSVEFEQIREYVTGDDIRTLNWKATARKGGQLMVNNYTDERSQQVYCIIDKGRVMKMPFDGLSLLDYAINSTLLLTRVALLKQDRTGLVTFDENPGQIVPADRRAGQMNQILETLYSQQTQFKDSDFEKLYALIKTKITQRSLIVLFTNFESLSGLQRQLPYIRSIARTHLLLVVFFENTGLSQLVNTNTDNIETLYIRTIAEKFAHEKRLMVRELQQHGIATILTAPEHLTINTVNKYLELKARQAI